MRTGTVESPWHSGRAGDDVWDRGATSKSYKAKTQPSSLSLSLVQLLLFLLLVIDKKSPLVYADRTQSAFLPLSLYHAKWFLETFRVLLHYRSAGFACSVLRIDVTKGTDRKSRRFTTYLRKKTCLDILNDRILGTGGLFLSCSNQFWIANNAKMLQTCS